MLNAGIFQWFFFKIGCGSDVSSPRGVRAEPWPQTCFGAFWAVFGYCHTVQMIVAIAGFTDGRGIIGKEGEWGREEKEQTWRVTELSSVLIFRQCWCNITTVWLLISCWLCTDWRSAKARWWFVKWSAVMGECRQQLPSFRTARNWVEVNLPCSPNIF